MGQINAGKFIASTGIEFPSYTNNNKPNNLGAGATIYNSDNEELDCLLYTSDAADDW